jgi:hypothetical protein
MNPAMRDSQLIVRTICFAAHNYVPQPCFSAPVVDRFFVDPYVEPICAIIMPPLITVCSANCGNDASVRSRTLRVAQGYAATRTAEVSQLNVGMEERMEKVLGLVGATLMFAGPVLAADLARSPVYKAPPTVAPFS